MDRNAIREQIDRIQQSASIVNKNQLRALLEFLFEHMEAQAALKPDRVIRELWPTETATKSSADVATEMNRLRRALESYYSGEGRCDPILILLPRRSVPGPDGSKERRWIVAEPRCVPLADPIPTPASHPVVEDKDVSSSESPAQLDTKARGNLRKVWALVAVAVMLAILAGVTVSALTSDRRPQTARLDGETFTVMNGEGKELWHKKFPGGFIHESSKNSLETRTWFGDLEGNGHTEVLLLYLPADNPNSHSSTLICYSETGKERWRWTPGRVWPEIAGPAIYQSKGLGVLKAPPGQPRRIVVTSDHVLYYPNQIALIDANGKTISEYWHSGWLYHLTLASFGVDGREKILASGTSNGYHLATMVVLDPERVFGASREAARPEIQFHGLGEAQEQMRLLFPRSDINKEVFEYNEGQEIVAGPDTIRLSVREGWFRPGGVYIWYEFDKNFHLLSATADDQFRGAHKEYYLKSKNNHPFSATEEAQFQKVRCLVGCAGDFVSVERR